MFTRRLLFAVFAVFHLAFLQHLSAQEYTHCRRPAINGYEKEHIAAEAMIAKSYAINKFDNLFLYVSARRGQEGSEPQLYIHSNHKESEGGNSLKLSIPKSTLDAIFGKGRSPRLMDVFSSVMNVEERNFSRIDYMKTSVIVDPEAYNVFKSLEFGRPKSLEIHSPNFGKRPLITVGRGERSKIFIQISPPPPNSRLFINAAMTNGKRVMDKLRETSFDAENTLLLHAVSDKSTLDFLDQKIPSHLRRSIGDDVSNWAFLDLLSKDKHKTIFLLGHIEGESFFFGQKSIPTKVIEYYARSNDLSIGILGCESAKTSEGLVVDKYVNSLSVARQYKKALGSNNYLEFFHHFSSGEFGVAINESTIKRMNSRSTYVSTRSELYGEPSAFQIKSSPKGLMDLVKKVR